MTKQSIIERTVEAINRLPDNKAEEISDFADFVIKRFEDQRLSEELKHVVSNSKTFEFLHHEEDLYSEADIKEKYNG
jgi:iron-sulfur cluster repair protein YtfE (RIC family)